MPTFFKQKRFAVAYFVCFLLFLISIFSQHFLMSPLLSWILISFVIFVPGFSLARIFKFQIDGLAGRLVLWLGLGWTYGLGFSFLSIIAGLTISAATTVFMIVTGILLILALIFDLRRTHQDVKPIHWQAVFNFNNLPLLLVLVYLGFILIDLVANGSLYSGGDAGYHISTLRKVVEGQPLTVANLSYVKNQIEIAYAFPIWHVLMGIMTHLANGNIFMIWREMCVPLVAMAFLTWYWLFRQILPTRNLAYLATFFYAAFNYNWKYGYELSTLPIPHSLMQFLLLPLLVALVLHYIFKLKNNWLFLIFLTLLTILVGVVHLTGYFYFLIIMVVFAMVYSILKFRESDFPIIRFKLLAIIFASLISILPLAFILQLKGHVISNFWLSFHTQDYPTGSYYNTFKSWDILVKYAYLFLPIVFIFSRKYRKLVLILALFLALPLVSNHFISAILTKNLGMIFVKRFYGTVVWYFPVWAMFFGFLFLLADRVLNLIHGKLRTIINYSFYGLAILFFWHEYFDKLVPKVYRETASTIYTSITSNHLEVWLVHYYLWFLVPFSLMVIFLYFWHSKSTEKFLTFEETKNQGLVFCLFVLVFLIFSSPAQARFIRSFDFDKVYKVIEPTTISSEKNALGAVGGYETVDFIKKNIPSKAVFDVSGGFFYLPQLVDVQMSNYCASADVAYDRLYDPKKWSINTKIGVIEKDQIEYLMVTGKPKNLVETENVLDQNPEYFQKIYRADAIIYKVNRVKIAHDLGN